MEEDPEGCFYSQAGLQATLPTAGLVTPAYFFFLTLSPFDSLISSMTIWSEDPISFVPFLEDHLLARHF